MVGDGVKGFFEIKENCTNFVSSICSSKPVICSTQESKNGTLLALKSLLLIRYWVVSRKMAIINMSL